MREQVTGNREQQSQVLRPFRFLGFLQTTTCERVPDELQTSRAEQGRERL